MLSPNEAVQIIERNLPNGRIDAYVTYKNVYLFQVFINLPGEEGLDPFYSVDINTGEFRDFSVIDDGSFFEISELFEKAKGVV